MRFFYLFLLCLFSAVYAIPDPSADPCKSDVSPAFEQTKAAFEGLKNGVLFVLGSLMNAEPTHSELIEAAKWQMGEVERLRNEAKTANAADKSDSRRRFFSLKLNWLSVEVSVVNALIKAGVPSWPWLGKAYEWAKNAWSKLKGAWNSFVDKWKKFWGINKIGDADGTEMAEMDDISEAEKADGRTYVNSLQDLVSGIDSSISELQSTNVCNQ